MLDAKPTYHLPPNFSTSPPPDGPFHLGTILKDFEHKENMAPLNQDERVDIETNIYSDHKGEFTATRSQLRSGEFGLWAKIMGIQGVGAEANISAVRNDTDTYSFESLDTEYFYPTKSYVSSCVALSDVEDYLEGHRYKKSVYLVTGLKVAKGVKVKVDKSSSVEGRISAGFKTPEGMTAVGPRAGAKLENKPVFEFTESSDIVVGIQCLRLFHCKTKWFGSETTLKTASVTTGATFHGVDKSKPEQEPDNFIAVWPEDFKIQGLKMHSFEGETWMISESDS